MHSISFAGNLQELMAIAEDAKRKGICRNVKYYGYCDKQGCTWKHPGQSLHSHSQLTHVSTQKKMTAMRVHFLKAINQIHGEPMVMDSSVNHHPGEASPKRWKLYYPRAGLRNLCGEEVATKSNESGKFNKKWCLQRDSLGLVTRVFDRHKKPAWKAKSKKKGTRNESEGYIPPATYTASRFIGQINVNGRHYLRLIDTGADCSVMGANNLLAERGNNGNLPKLDKWRGKTVGTLYYTFLVLGEWKSMNFQYSSLEGYSKQQKWMLNFELLWRLLYWVAS
jgi:hypothetical protein